MDRELIRDIGQAVICLAVLILAAVIQLKLGVLPDPWPTLIVAVVAAIGLGDGIRLVAKRTNNKAVSVGLEKDADHAESDDNRQKGNP